MKDRIASCIPALLVVAATGCEKDLVNDTPDAAVDAVPLLPGNFDCVGVDWPTHVRDPMSVMGLVSDFALRPIVGATVEIREVATDASLGQATSGGTLATKGKWATSIPTGGVAPTIYRKNSAAGYLDTYAYDAFDEFAEFSWNVSLISAADFDNFSQMAGMTPDPSLGVMWIDVFDCHAPSGPPMGLIDYPSTPVAGATIEAPPGARVIYARSDGYPDPALTSTSDGWAGALIVGVQPGMTDVVIHAGPITYRSWPVMVRAHALAYSARHP